MLTKLVELEMKVPLPAPGMLITTMSCHHLSFTPSTCIVFPFTMNLALNLACGCSFSKAVVLVTESFPALLALGLLKLNASQLPAGLSLVVLTTATLAQALFFSYLDPGTGFRYDPSGPPSNPSSNCKQGDFIPAPPPLLLTPPAGHGADPNSFAGHHGALFASLADLIPLRPSPHALFQSQVE